ncbi:MAG: alpha-L-arabinofuranosidase, partial [Clostridia bacterium]|nr:alpha-L-arabinofuranosidase [Clostridia bacterium]
MEKLYVLAPSVIGKIKPELYGHFAEHIGGVIYDGIYVGKDSKVENVNGFRKFIIDKLRAINAPVVRWPGGCFAEIYDWRDGIGENRPTRVNWWTHYDKVSGRYEPNEVGTHEFCDFC